MSWSEFSSWPFRLYNCLCTTRCYLSHNFCWVLCWLTICKYFLILSCHDYRFWFHITELGKKLFFVVTFNQCFNHRMHNFLFGDKDTWRSFLFICHQMIWVNINFKNLIPEPLDSISWVWLAWMGPTNHLEWAYLIFFVHSLLSDE